MIQARWEPKPLFATTLNASPPVVSPVPMNTRTSHRIKAAAEPSGRYSRKAVISPCRKGVALWPTLTPALNVVTAGSAVPIKFSLNGNYGLDIFAAGFPASSPVGCSATEPGTVIEETVTAGNSSLSYNAVSDEYSYVWKTDRSCKGTCRVLVVRLDDNTEHLARFRFR